MHLAIHNIEVIRLAAYQDLGQNNYTIIYSCMILKLHINHCSAIAR